METMRRPKAFQLTQEKAFDAARCLSLADQALSAPPREFVERVSPKGKLVLRFALPARLCRPQNTEDRHRAVWAFVKDRSELLTLMSTQLRQQGDSVRWRMVLRPDGKVHTEMESPLEGRPMIRAIRFTGYATDSNCNFAKQAIDLLMPTRVSNRRPRVKGKAIPGSATKSVTTWGLGVIRGDHLSAVDQRQWWEFLTRKEEGFVVIEVWTGEVES